MHGVGPHPWLLAGQTGGQGALQSDLAGIVALFGAALAAAWLMRLLRLPSILGFLLAGVLIGPSGLGIIGPHEVDFYAELGLVLLLFTVGLELSPGPLVRSGPRLLWGAALQMGGTAVLAGVVLHVVLGLGWLGAAVGGLAVSLSSTAININHFSEGGRGESAAAAIAIFVLLVQDVGAIAALILMPLFGRAPETTLSATLLVAAGKFAVLIVLTLAARWALPFVSDRMFRRGGRELMTLFAILMACLGAWAVGLLGWSWGLGSFIAGLLLSRTELRHQLKAEITPFRDVFNALFFISIGMLVNTQVFAAHLGPLLVAIAATLLLKALVAGGAVLGAGWPLRVALTVGMGLCTLSEFSYVVAKEAESRGLLSAEFVTLLIAWTVGTMVLGALLLPRADALAGALARRLQPDPPPQPAHPLEPDEEPLPRSHVVIVGYGVNGRNLASVLRATRIPYVVIEMNRDTAYGETPAPERVVLGDATRRAILERAGLMTARALVIAIAEPHATRRIVAQAHAARPDLYILARTRYVAELDPLYRLGARRVIPEEFETSIEIFAHVLKEFGVPDNVIDQQVTLVRAGRYGMLRGRVADRTLRAEWLRILEAAVTQTYLVLPGSPADGRTIRELDLRANSGATIVAVTRGGKPTPNPAAEFTLQAGDVLVLVGAHKQLDQARTLLDPEPDEGPVSAPTS